MLPNLYYFFFFKSTFLYHSLSHKKREGDNVSLPFREYDERIKPWGFTPIGILEYWGVGILGLG
jgi:hypothetical protein